jgi:hypothetical protein
MATMDIFTQDAFRAGEMIGTVEKMPYAPGLLRTMGLFTPKPVRTEFVAVESKEGALAIIPTTPRGAPLPQATHNGRKLRRFDTVRIAKGDSIRASEIQGIRAFGSTTELQQVQEIVVERQMTLRTDMELTHELHRLGALQGKVLDADGSVIIDWFEEWGIAEPAAIAFNLDTAATDVEKICRAILRTMARKSKGLWRPGSYVAALTGDSFFDKLTAHKTVRETFLNQSQASALRNAFGPAAQNLDGAFATFTYGGILFINYRGTDEFDDGASAGSINAIGIKSTQAKFFPVNTPGVFQVAQSPGESFDMVNQPGRELYPMIIPDDKRNTFVDVELYSYPLYMCTRPEMLLTAVENTA